MRLQRNYDSGTDCCSRLEGQAGKLLSSPHSRREFLLNAGLVVAGTTLAGLQGSRWLETSKKPDNGREAGGGTVEPNNAAGSLSDTLNGLIAFVVPGSDPFSVQQGVTTPEAGAVDANITEVLILALDQLAPFLPNFSQVVAGILNQVAQAIDGSVTGPFESAFANLSFSNKAAVFAFMESNEELLELASGLFQFVGFLSYSEAGVIDFATGTLTGTPLGWTLSGYEGIADGRDEFKGYFQNRKKVS